MVSKATFQDLKATIANIAALANKNVANISIGMSIMSLDNSHKND